MNAFAPVRPRLRVEVIHDFVCPWSCIGVEQLVSTVRARTDLEIAFVWRPFLLNSSPVPVRMDFARYLRARYGSEERADRILRLIRKFAHDTGCIIRFDRIRHIPSTLDAHRLVAWAASRGDCVSLVIAIFRAFFRDGLDIGNTSTLVHIAEANGFDPDIAFSFLSGQTMTGTVTSSQVSTQRAGINGIPSVIIEGLAITGVQEAPVLNRLLDTALCLGASSDVFHERRTAGSALFSVPERRPRWSD